MRQSATKPTVGKYRRTKAIRAKTSASLGGNKNHYKGEAAGYWARHRWLDVHVGRPRVCDECGATDKKRYEWANISGHYLRDQNDYRRLCRSCHIKWDRSRGVWGNTRRLLGRSTTIIRTSRER